MTASTTHTIYGTPVSSGIAYGRPCFSNIAVSQLIRNSNHKTKEITQQLTDTFTKLSDDLLDLASDAEARIDHDSAEIFLAHRLIIQDSSIQESIFNSVINNLRTAEEAIETCFDDYYAYFNTLSDQYAARQAEIFSELKQLLLNLLRKTDITLSCKDTHNCAFGECSLSNDHILIIKELNAYNIARISEHTKGIITELCGKKSHASIIAKALGIPVISGLTKLEQTISYNNNLLINGSNGQITIDPNQQTISSLKDKINKNTSTLEVSESLDNLTVFADINHWDNLEDAITVKADGIGLYRTEFDVLRAGRFLTEQEQYEHYQNLVLNMDSKPVYIRLFDLGADKNTEWLGIGEEENPALGNRGANYLLSHPEIVKHQARAIARASVHTHIHVIYPMITCYQQFIKLKQLFIDSINDINNHQLSHGIMFEVPSACLEAEQLYKEIDFGRIGSNDLVQYLFAYDRTKDDFDYDEFVKNPAIWNLIGELSQVAKTANKPLEVCGEMTNNPEYIHKLMTLGIQTVSAYPQNIAKVRKAAAV